MDRRKTGGRGRGERGESLPGLLPVYSTFTAEYATLFTFFFCAQPPRDRIWRGNPAPVSRSRSKLSLRGSVALHAGACADRTLGPRSGSSQWKRPLQTSDRLPRPESGSFLSFVVSCLLNYIFRWASSQGEIYFQLRKVDTSAKSCRDTSTHNWLNIRWTFEAFVEGLFLKFWLGISFNWNENFTIFFL